VYEIPPSVLFDEISEFVKLTKSKREDLTSRLYAAIDGLSESERVGVAEALLRAVPLRSIALPPTKYGPGGRTVLVPSPDDTWRDDSSWTKLVPSRRRAFA
jgi:hypothetical protein